VRSCLLDGEAGAWNGDCMPSFDRLRYRRADASVFLYVFDLLELNGQDLRCEPLEVRKATLVSVVAKAGLGLRFNEHLEHPEGDVVFRHACKLGLEGIVSKRLGPPYRSGHDSAMVKAIARAYRWRGMLEHGVYASITELAAAEKINQSYVCRVLRLTLLAPALVEAILDGRHPSRLQLRTLLNPFPSDWTAQAHYFA
jgi:hypothetical protein